MPARNKAPETGSTANLSFEAKLWLAADTALRACALEPGAAKLQVESGARDNLHTNRDADEPGGARQPAAGSPQGRRGGAEQYKAENVFRVPADPIQPVRRRGNSQGPHRGRLRGQHGRPPGQLFYSTQILA
jgi:hypothetical protein